MVEGVGLGVETPDPGCVSVGDLQHSIDHGLALRAIVHVAHLLEEGIEFRVGIVGGILAVGLDLAVGAIEQEEEVLRVRVIRVPAPHEDLARALAHFVLEAVVVRGADHQLDAELGELLAHPVEPGLVIGATGSGVEEQGQGLTRRLIATVRPAGLGEQGLGLVQGPAYRPPPLPLEDIGIDTGLPLPVTEDSRRQGRLGDQAAPVGEDGDVLLEVDGDGQGAPQQPGPLRLAPHHGVEHIEAHVGDGGPHRGQKRNPLGRHLRGQAGVALGVELHRLIEGVGRHA